MTQLRTADAGRLRATVLGGAAALGLLLPGCSASQAPGSAPGSPATLTVFAAASLTATFTTLAGVFEEAHPGVTVALNLAGSADLVAQLDQGAPADVFASADEATMAKATASGLIAGEAEVFATNVLTIAVPPDNPAGIATPADLARDGVRVVVCAAQVPCGAAAVKAEQAAGIDLHPVSEETRVTDVLAKVESGEADAGLVYATDVKAAAGDVLGIDFPQAAGAVNRYRLGVVASSTHPELARAFVELVTGQQGQRVLAGAGFGGR